MRHRKIGRSLGRDTAHREAMFRNMAVSLMEHELIKTTVPKAKELRRFIEPLITRAKEDSVANRRLVFNRLRNKRIMDKLFKDLGERYQDRPGGYLRILKCGNRKGDNAPMAYVELVDRPLISLDDDDDDFLAGSASKAVAAEAADTAVEAKAEEAADKVEAEAEKAEDKDK